MPAACSTCAWNDESAYDAHLALRDAHDPHQVFSDMLITALEGGSNYWYFLPDLSMVTRKKGEPWSVAIGRAVWHDGAEVPVDDCNEKAGTRLGMLTRASMEKALDLMMRKHPRHYADLFDGNDDATTADVWFQLAVMGDIVFG